MKTAIVVMDLGDEKWIKDYYNEYEANNYFVQYLNQRLIDLKKEGLILIEVNYGGGRHNLITVDFDFSTLSEKDFCAYIIDNNIDHLIYAGLHYPTCINNARALSSFRVKKKIKDLKVSIAVQLTRSLEKNYFRPLEYNSEHIDIKKIML